MTVCPECSSTDHGGARFSGANRQSGPNGYRVCDDCQTPPPKPTCCADGERRLKWDDACNWHIHRPWVGLTFLSFCPWCGADLAAWVPAEAN